MIQIECLTVGPFQSNCYIVSCSQTGEAIVVDAGDEAERILSVVRERGVSVKAIVNTHAHLDHVGALSAVKSALKVPVFMHRNELPIYEIVEAQAAMFGLPAPGMVEIDRLLADGELIEVGDLTAEVVLAPGHSPGSICLWFRAEVPPQVIVGDVLFQGSIGRTDLPGASHEAMIDTLRTRIVPMPDDTIVHSGHGPVTTIGQEKRTNPFVVPLVGR